MQVTVQLFAAHREAVGSPVVTLVVPSGTKAGDIWTMLAAQHPALRQVAPPTAVAVNDEVRPAEHALADGDRVALLAPVSGGGTLLDLVREPIRVDALLDAVRHPAAGAVILFLGTVREHSRGRSVQRLEYDAYEALARKEMARIAAHATERWGVRIAIVHRLGTLQIGEISVAIAVAAPHRRDAFEAGRFAIDTLKQTVPIWKKEVWASGSEWIGQEESPPPR
ncbi:MAG: molybdenum cofactor biosynthesis protein MoaE [Armatimonadota bacterium]|nr:molybdenum cofactor biosynthesis protein MoaE [Armatimonadota bacterium]MDR7519652.1 molybdenum cofactor biosynthesis protein MoaE [Armatimonadota bacterium]